MTKPENFSAEAEETVSVSEVAEVILGGTPRTNVPTYWSGNIKWASAKDVANNESRYLCATERKITHKGVNNSAAKVLPRNTIIITARGTVGQLALLSEPMAFNQTCYGLIAKEKILPLFLYYKLKSMLTHIDSVSYGTVFKTITMRTFDEIKIKIPSKGKQKEIVDILDSLDNKIEVNTGMNKTLEAISQALFKHWFIDFEFPDENGDPYKSSGGEMVFNDELEEKIPKDWKVRTLKDISYNYDSKRIPLSKRERQERKGRYPYYGATCIVDFVDDYIFEGHFVLMGEDGSVISDNGYPILQYVSGKFWANNHTHILQGKGLSTEFLYLLLLNTYVGHIVTGAVQPKINQTNMNTLRFPIPSCRVLNDFEKIIQPIFSVYRKNNEEKASLNKTRDTLLPKLMSGEKRAIIKEGAHG